MKMMAVRSAVSLLVVSLERALRALADVEDGGASSSELIEAAMAFFEAVDAADTLEKLLAIQPALVGLGFALEKMLATFGCLPGAPAPGGGK
jgi:hypothetical protein